MQKNSFYNLMNQCVQEQKSLWRIENHYIKEATDKDEKKFWEEMKKDKKKHIDDLLELMQKACGK